MAMGIEEIDLTERQRKIVRMIHFLVAQLEDLNNTGKAHPYIALLKELTSEVIAPDYLREKLNLLFDDVRYSYRYRSD